MFNNFCTLTVQLEIIIKLLYDLVIHRAACLVSYEDFLYFHPAVFVIHFCKEYITVKHSKLRVVVFIDLVKIWPNSYKVNKNNCP
jgi:hypothetical protein